MYYKGDLKDPRIMTVEELLRNKRQELEAERERIHRELEQVEAALEAIAPITVSPAASDRPGSGLSIDEAIVRAVGAGCRTPLTILAYLGNELLISTTVNSIRTRVSKLYQEGRIAKGNNGWAPAGHGQMYASTL